MTIFAFLGGWSLCADRATVVIVVMIQAQSRNFGAVEQVELRAGTCSCSLGGCVASDFCPPPGDAPSPASLWPCVSAGCQLQELLTHPALKSSVTGLTT